MAYPFRRRWKVVTMRRETNKAKVLDSATINCNRKRLVVFEPKRFYHIHLRNGGILAVDNEKTPHSAGIAVITSLIIAALLPALTGCFCTIVGREYSVSDVAKDERLAYEEVRDVKALKKWNSEAIPITVKATYTTEKQKNEIDALHVILFCSTLGVIPFWEKTETIHSVNVQTPLGATQGTYVETKREFIGWVPYLLPFASWGEEDDGDDEVNGKVYQKELTSRLVSQFAPRWNAAVERAKKRNASVVETRRIASAKQWWSAEQVEILRMFALRESPGLWKTVQTLRAERKVREEKLQRLREDLKLFGRDPENDSDYLALRRASEDIRSSINAVYAKIEEAYLAFKKFEATPGRKEYSETMRRALEDGIKEAEATEHRYKEMTRQK